MRASILEAPQQLSTGQLPLGLPGDTLLVSPYAAELSIQQIPSYSAEQPDVVEACTYGAQSSQETTAWRQQFEDRLEARTHAVASFIGDALAHSRFRDDVAIALTRSKTIESIIGKASRKDDAMYDLIALHAVTKEEDPEAARLFLEHIREATGTPVYRPNGKPAVTKLGNRYSGDGFSGQQAKLVTLVDGQLLLAEVQAYTPSEYIIYWGTRSTFEDNRGYGGGGRHENPAYPGHRMVAYRNLATAGLMRFIAD